MKECRFKVQSRYSPCHSLRASREETVLGWSGPRICLCTSKHFSIIEMASSIRLWDVHVCARLPILLSVSGCSSPSTLFLVYITCTSSSSASFHRPCFQYVDARLVILVSMPGCSLPSTLLLVSITYTSSSSASFHRP